MVTVITKTIGPNPPAPAPPTYDYGSFTLAEADVENIATLAFGSTDLVANDGAIVFEADAATYNESVTFSSTLTTDATRNLTYKPAAGSEHNGDQSSGVIVQFNGNTIVVLDEFTVIKGLNLKSTSGSGYPVSLRANGSVARSCLLTTPWAAGFIYREGTSTYPCVFENCVMYGDTHAVLALEDRAGLETYGLIVNCTAIGHTSRALQLNSTNATGTLNIECHNLLVLGTRVQIATGAGTTNLTGSGSNFGSSLDPWPVALQGSPATITASTAYDPGAGDFALYVGKNGALLDSPNNDVIDQGVGPDVNSSVPRTDILGNTRYGANANPGAFEVPQATTVLTRTIGPNPAFPEPPKYDYGSFTLAESDVENIATSTDLVNENEAIVFEADAGTYNEPSQVLVESTLVTDATRHVTYKAAPGSEHGGILGAGVFIFTSSNGFNIEDANTHLIGLGVRAQFNACYTLAPGTVARDCIFESTTNHGFIGVQNASVVAENCVSFHQGVRYGFYLYVTSGYTASGKYINCTAINTAPSGGYNFNFNSPGGTITAEVVNCLGIGDETYRVTATGPVTVTGSNNFGVSNFPFPVALQGSPYPVTATTDTDPGPGDWAIYDADTGALIDDPDNDVLGGGVGPDVNLDVPTTDIRGIPRTGSTTDPGAFVLPPVEQDTWTPVMVRRNDPVDVYGVLTFGDAYINAVEDTLSVTGADGTDATPAIPVGTRALWIQLVSQTGAAAGETCDVSIEVSASQSLTLATLNGAGTAVGNVPGLMQFPVDCLGQNDPNTPVYPRVKMVTGSSVGASDVVTIRVVAICGQQTNTTWS